MTLVEFERLVFTAAMRSPICDIPSMRRLTSTTISLRISIESGGFIDAFYNEQTDTTAFAFICKGRRLFVADNTVFGTSIPFRIRAGMNHWRSRCRSPSLWRSSSKTSTIGSLVPQSLFLARRSRAGVPEYGMVQSSARFPKAADYERAMARELDRTRASEIVHKAAERYDELYAGRKHYDNRALRQHLAEGILPGVALYQALLDDPGTKQAALELAEAALAEGALAGRRSMERLGRLPFYFWLMRVLIKPVMRLNFPAEGWETEWVEASGDALAFNMHRCFYQDVLAGYGVPELTALYCKMDDLTYDGVSRHVRWARKRTLGRGDACCDFRWERVRGQ